MSTLLRTDRPSLKTLPIVIFNDFIPVAMNLRLPSQYVKSNRMCLEDIHKNAINSSVKQYIEHIQGSLSTHFRLMAKYLEKNPDYSSQIKNDVRDHTLFTGGTEHWDITNLVRRYNITGKDVFLAMVSNTSPFGVGIFSHKEGKMDNLKFLEETWDERIKTDNCKYIHFDYFNGVGVKNSFPVDTMKLSTTLNMRRYNDRNGYDGYNRVLGLLESKIHYAKENSVELREIVDEPKDVKVTTPSLPKNNSHYVKLVEKYNIVPEDIPEKKQSYYNHRNSYDIEKKWDHMIFPSALSGDVKTYHDFVLDAIKEGYFDLDRYFFYSFRYFNYDYDKEEEIKSKSDSYALIPYYETTLENMSIVNCLMFGGTNVRLQDMSDLLDLIRYKRGYNVEFVDNYVVNEYMYGGLDGRRYDIEFNTDDKHLNELSFNSRGRDKLNLAKAIIRIMNEVKPELLNHHNYNVVQKYIESIDKDMYQMWNLVPGEMTRIKDIDFED